MPKLTIITGAHKTGKTERADWILNTHHATVVVDEAENRINTQPLIERDMVVVLNVPEGTEVVHEHLVPRREEEREYRITGFPGCDAFHPQTEAEAVAILRREAAKMKRLADEYRVEGDYSMVAEMHRRLRNANYESRVVTEWEEGK